MRSSKSRVLAFFIPVAAVTAWPQAVDLRADGRPTVDSASVAVPTSSARPRVHLEPTTEEGRFVTRGAGYSLNLGPAESVLLLSEGRQARERPLGLAAAPVAVHVRLLGANTEALAEAGEPLPGRSHYFRGADRSKWRRDVAHFGRVTYRQVYPGMDLTYYGNAGALQHDFVVAPGADAGRIRYEIEGATSIRLDTAGDLIMATPIGEVRQKAPVAYQDVKGQRVAVASRYVLHGDHKVGFQVGPRDERLPLVIDPILSYSTFMGGSAQDSGEDVTIAPDGTLWFVGTTFSSDLPQVVNGPSGDQDAFVSHFASDGKTLLSTTYIGGGSAEYANRAKATASGVYVVGGTVSSDFPSPDGACPVCRNPPPGLQSWELFYPPSDTQSFLIELDATGLLTHAVVYGSDRLDDAWVLGLDRRGRIYVGSISCGDGFPTTVGAYRRSRTPAADPSVPDNECDSAVARFTESPAGFALGYGTYLGGTGADFVAGLAVTPDGAAWVVGGTTSGDFPTTRRARQTANAGGWDAFVSRIAPGGGSLQFSTLFGGSGYDYPFDVALDRDGSAYVVGRTESTDFPTTRRAFQRTAAGGSDGWVSKFVPRGSLAWSTRLAGSGFDWPFAIAVGRGGSSYIAGRTDSADFPTWLPAQAAPGGGEDAFVSRLSSEGSRLLWSTYLGGPGSDQAHGLARDGQGGVWIAGTTSGGLPPTLDAIQPDFGGVSDGFLVRLDESASIRTIPGQLTFWRTSVGRTRGPRHVVVFNNGRVPVDIRSVALGGTDSGDFALESACGPTIDPRESCAIEVAFAPSAEGTRSATLLVDSSAAAAPVSVALTGTGVLP